MKELKKAEKEKKEWKKPTLDNVTETIMAKPYFYLRG